MSPHLSTFAQGKKTIFTARLSTFSETSTLRTVLGSRIAPLSDLHLFSADDAAQTLVKSLEKIYVPTSQSVALAVRILGTAIAHARTTYADEATYIRNSNLSRIEFDREPTTWIITGLAGSGKSALLAQLKRVLNEAVPIYQASPHCAPRPILGVLFLHVSGKIKQGDVLRSLAEDLGMTANSGSYPSSINVDAIRKEIFRQGCSAIVVDESQAMASGKTAGAVFVNFIAYLRGFGVPVIVVGNYSMCHGILAQPSQMRQRVVNDPYIVQPNCADDPDFLKLLRVYKEAMGEICALELPRDADTVQWLTGGGGRAMRELMGIAYKTQRHKSPANPEVTITIESLKEAYSSSSYFAFREEIELLREYRTRGGKIRQDLLCPFKMVGEALEVEQKLRDQLRMQMVAREMLLRSMSSKEREAVSAGEQVGPEFSEPADAIAFQMQLRKNTKGKPGTTTGKHPVALGGATRQKRRQLPTAADAARSWGG